ncbi:MAG: GNAT family N-acetyltransferase [Dyella sp.]
MSELIVDDLQVRFHPRIDAFPAQAWDALRPDDNPFVSHAFLALLERSGCIRADWGWQAHHLGLYRGERLVAAAPLYLKGNSHGEFVFDWSWASAYERAGGDYYPKLLNAVPYSPVPGPRLLAGADAASPALRRALARAMHDEAQTHGLSSVHANFLDTAELDAFDGDWLVRGDVQFHWHNANYADFDAFLAALSSKKRKNIRQERAQVERSGLTLEWRGGASLSADEWRQIHALYEATFDAKGNHAALTRRFFGGLGQTLGDTVQLALARDGERIVAMALFLQSGSALYGRYWGALTDAPSLPLGTYSALPRDIEYPPENRNRTNLLHFELCYYQGIEYCIKHGLSTFEPGAQGRETKMPRGFLPTPTHSRHYIVHESFREAVRDSLKHELANKDAYYDEMMEHSPYAAR